MTVELPMKQEYRLYINGRTHNFKVYRIVDGDFHIAKEIEE